MSAELLTEPQRNAQRQALDQALVEALVARAAAGSDTADALAIELRQVQADPSTLASLRAVLGRLEAGQRPALVVHGSEAAAFAADRFGLSFRLVDGAEAALTAASGATRALVELGTRPWWGRMLTRPELRVIGAFPDTANSRPRALLIGAESTGPSGNDCTFWITDSSLPDVRIAEWFAAQGLAIQALAASGGLKLFSLAGYVQSDDPRLTDAPGTLTGVIGAAPLF